MDRKRGSAKKSPKSKPKLRHPVQDAPLPDPLSPRMAPLFYIGIVATFIVFLVGLAGVFVLLDAEKQTKWYSHTKFAELWKAFTERNPFTTTVCVNGGAATMIFLIKRLYQHHKALKTRKTQ